ncbi:potassium-transporting ATPase subunit KdpA [Kerstersia gyiorum]|uniref:potassium-transporting ATPase subunit KdpA n=1 Tax=Kerstersia gyiorum TaxID=206506 RepID=UPI00209E1A55|nr:potassium-transporting ATPase subunit KdpA [Kerstersia gyiorum]MCP1633330.1 K+-transporting ATPase ATPase A chain [Kerstersia gyiorum]MCP1636201.1 K+-transporting ATPase ATPase A chain [Kerstersia gyiorum]MCP1671232.1 K+-transporting ATPase ATPase A chain [Kerstersia gyiorum]MCP1679112.1 K+-transporting ATPase ATPase A chain [Kerstersia gyiorum]MCP1681913.1 K+-transporting ATPase ATPase A chain [Kerstersia gyiorum]
MAEFLLVFVVAVILGWPLGRYLATVMRGAPMWGDAIFLRLERPLYALLGVRAASGMSWKGYAMAFLASNAVLAVLVWALLMTQAWLPLNPDDAPNMSWDLALHTMVSFLTNTNQQHYSGQAQLSYLSQMAGIVALQVVTPMMGLAVVTASLRAFFGGRRDAGAPAGTDAIQATSATPATAITPATPAAVDVGNFWVDVIRPTLRFMLPLCLVLSVLLTSQGVPATLSGGPLATLLEASAERQAQKIPVGPVAPMVAIKQLGTNGGGWYGPNGTVALENPTPLSNLLETLALILVPVAVTFMVGAFTGRRRLSALVFGTMLGMSLVSAGLAVWSEAYSATAAAPALMEGKEVRLGAAPSALYAALTTQTSNGSVVSMHDSLAPLTSLVSLGDMLVNAIWGGIGCGLQQFMVYLLLAVFLAGLMTGRSPELFGRKIEAPEIRLLAGLLLLQPVVLLVLTAVTVSVPGLAGTSNPGFHGLSQVFYEYTSAFANNGSGFEGLADNSVWWNVTASLALAAGRYPGLIVPLVIAARLACKRRMPEGSGSLQVETPTFALVLVAIVVVMTLLQFMPVLVLGPVADHLSLVQGQYLPAPAQAAANVMAH